MAQKPKIISDYFKTFTIPKNRIPRQDEDDEIIVASSNSSRANTQDRTLSPGRRQTSLSSQKSLQNDASIVKRGHGRPRKNISNSPSKLRSQTPLLEQQEPGRSTPTRRSPRKHMAGVDETQDVPPDSSGLTPAQSSLKTTPTKVRTFEAVEIPSPNKRSSSSMPAPSQIPAHESRNLANVSFSSFSSLTNLSSQSSSRRVVKNGIPAVTNSDSASMSSSSSDDELVDLESFAPRKKRRLTPPVAEGNTRLEASYHAQPTRSSTRISGEQANKRVRDSLKPSSPPPTATYKHSLLTMARQSAKEAVSEARIAQAEADMQEAERLQERREQLSAQTVKTKSMAKEFALDSDEEERMLMAMERTEVLRGEEKFYFFSGEAQSTMQLVFPTAELSAYGLDFLQDDAKRQHACTSGFLATVASQQGLPGSVTTWIHQDLFHESSEEICESYVTILDALVRGQHELPDLPFSLSETHPGQTVRDLGDNMKLGGDTSLPANVKYALVTMATLAPLINPIDRACALAELILLNNDDNVRDNIDIQLHIECAMQAILNSSNTIDQIQVVFRETTRQIVHASSVSRHLLSRAIASVPSTTLHLHQLRRKLALHILLDASIGEDFDVASPSTGVRLLLRLKKHSSFHIAETTDYTTLHSLADLLDVAIDVGFSDFAFLAGEDQVRQQDATQGKSLFGHAATTQTPEETSFNAQIDDLAAHLQTMSSKIRDAGTSHLKRTEVKSALERLIVRLQGAVRTKTRSRKGIFGGAASVGALHGYLKREESETKTSSMDGGEKLAPNRLPDQSLPGTQPKVTWRHDVVGMGHAGPGADESDAERGSADEDDDDDDDSM